jgi:hypothetical protein
MNQNRVEPHDDDEFDAEEIDAAAEERITPDVAPEENSKTKDLTEWDQPASPSAGAVPRTPLEDETSISEQLIEEGIDEADREQRLASADPDFEP